jgi:hypothetical protein
MFIVRFTRHWGIPRLEVGDRFSETSGNHPTSHHESKKTEPLVEWCCVAPNSSHVGVVKVTYLKSFDLAEACFFLQIALEICTQTPNCVHDSIYTIAFIPLQLAV